MFGNDGSLFNGATSAANKKAQGELDSAVSAERAKAAVEISNARQSARNAQHSAEGRTADVMVAAFQMKNQNASLKAALHRNRVAVAAHVSTEEVLVAELAKLAPQNPLADISVVNKMSSYKEDVLFFDKDIAKQTLGDVDVETFFHPETITKNQKAAALAEEALATNSIFNHQ